MRWTRLWCSVGGWKPASGVSAGRLAALHQELSTQCPFPGTAPPDPGEAPEGREEDGDREESSTPCSAPGRWPAPDHRDFNQEPCRPWISAHRSAMFLSCQGCELLQYVHRSAWPCLSPAFGEVCSKPTPGFVPTNGPSPG